MFLCVCERNTAKTEDKWNRLSVRGATEDNDKQNVSVLRLSVCSRIFVIRSYTAYSLSWNKYPIYKSIEKFITKCHY